MGLCACPKPYKSIPAEWGVHCLQPIPCLELSSEFFMACTFPRGSGLSLDTLSSWFGGWVLKGSVRKTVAQSSVAEGPRVRRGGAALSQLCLTLSHPGFREREPSTRAAKACGGRVRGLWPP